MANQGSVLTQVDVPDQLEVRGAKSKRHVLLFVVFTTTFPQKSSKQ
jgi:hypothetical protein